MVQRYRLLQSVNNPLTKQITPPMPWQEQWTQTSDRKTDLIAPQINDGFPYELWDCTYQFVFDSVARAFHLCKRTNLNINYFSFAHPPSTQHRSGINARDVPWNWTMRLPRILTNRKLKRCELHRANIFVKIAPVGGRIFGNRPSLFL